MTKKGSSRSSGSSVPLDIGEPRSDKQPVGQQDASLAELARFPEMNPGPVLRVDLEGTVLAANRAARDAFGAELPGRCWLALCPGIDEAVWRGVVDATGPVPLERRIGDREYVFTHRRDPESRQVFVFGADISELKEAQRALRQADELVRLLLDSTGEGIYGVDLEGDCTFANPACLRLLGFDSDAELMGRNMHELVHHTRPNGDPYPVKECRIYRAFREHEGTHVDDEVMFRKNGSSFPAEYWSYPVERDGGLVGCVVTFVDISERRRVEEELRQTEKMAALGKLSAGLAHELNNPAAAAGRAAGQLVEELDGLLTGTIELGHAAIGPECWEMLADGYREFLGRSPAPGGLSALEASDREEALLSWLEAHGVADPWEIAPTLVEAGVRVKDLEAIADGVSEATLGPAIQWLDKALDVHELAGTVMRSSGNISALVDVVKSYSQMDRAPVQEVDVHEGIEDTLKILGHKLKGEIEVVREYDRGLPRIQVRCSELNQVWTNLIDNALSALGERGVITIRSYRDGAHLTVEIADDGPGIPEAIQPRIFDPFFTTKEVGEGVGLGLDIVRRIVTKRCGGGIDFRSRPGETVFRIRLPLLQCDLDTEEEEPAQ